MKTYYLFKPEDARIPMSKVLKVTEALDLKVTLDTRDFYYPTEYENDANFMINVECLEDFLINTTPGERNLMDTSIQGIELVWFDYHGQDAIIRVIDVSYGKLKKSGLPFQYSYSDRRRESYIYNIFGDMLFSLEDTEDLYTMVDTDKKKCMLEEIRSIFSDSTLGYLAI